MTIQTTSFIAKYYRWMFRGELPNNFCTLFWNTLFSVIFLPCTIIVFPVAMLFDEYIWHWSSLSAKIFRGVAYWLLFFLLPVFGLVIIDKYVTHAWKDWNFYLAMAVGWLAIVVFLLIGALVILSIVGIVIGIRSLADRYNQNKEIKQLISEPSKLTVMWDTVRNKYCTKITWK